jgi:hypothetical protein
VQVISLALNQVYGKISTRPTPAMFASYEIDPAASEVRMTYHVHPTSRNWTRLMDEILKDPRFVPGMSFLFDKREVGATPDNAYAEAVARYFREHRDQIGRCAVLVKGLLAYGMARVCDGYCADDRVRSFTDVHEAEEWLAGRTVSRQDLAA